MGSLFLKLGSGSCHAGTRWSLGSSGRRAHGGFLVAEGSTHFIRQINFFQQLKYKIFKIAPRDGKNQTLAGPRRRPDLSARTFNSSSNVKSAFNLGQGEREREREGEGEGEGEGFTAALPV